MGKIILYSLNWVNAFSYTVLLFISIYIVKKYNVPYYFNNFFWFPLVGAIVGFFYLISIQGTAIHFFAAKINHLSTIFHFLFLSVLLFRITGKNKIIKKIIICGSVILVILNIVDLNHRTSFAFSSANFFLFLFSFFYFLQVLNSDPISDLFKSPEFFICCGVFIGSGLIVPFNILNSSFLIKEIPEDMVYILVAISSSGFLIMNLFFIKAFLCVKTNLK